MELVSLSNDNNVWAHFRIETTDGQSGRQNYNMATESNENSKFLIFRKTITESSWFFDHQVDQ